MVGPRLVDLAKGLIRGLSKQDIRPIERDGPTSDYQTCGHGAPENIRSRKFPNGEQGSEDGDEYAGAGYPERHAPDHMRIEIASSLTPFFRHC